MQQKPHLAEKWEHKIQVVSTTQTCRSWEESVISSRTCWDLFQRCGWGVNVIHNKPVVISGAVWQHGSYWEVVRFYKVVCAQLPQIHKSISSAVFYPKACQNLIHF